MNQRGLKKADAAFILEHAIRDAVADGNISKACSE